MNDESASSSAANPLSAHDNAQATRSRGEHASPSASRARKHREKNKRTFNKKRAEFLDDMLRAFDLMIYAELSAVYYIDCSFLRMVLRAMIQFFYLTPKPAMFPDPPKNQPYPVSLIVGTNVFCALLHLWVKRPEAGEATRGYLHGGLLLDFIGQQGPSSKLHMVALDALILILQVIMLCSLIERQNIKQALGSTNGQASAMSGTSSTVEQVQGSSAYTVQDHDHEERGLLRSSPPHALDDIELQSLAPAETGTRTVAEESGEADEHLTSIRTVRCTDAHIFDAFNSGQIIVVDLHVIDMVRNQYLANLDPGQNASPSFSIFSTHLPGGGRFGFRMRVGGGTLGQAERG